MKLTALDHQFIDWMAPLPEHRQIIQNKLEYKTDVVVQSPGHWLVTYGRNWGMYLFFLVELLLVLFKSAPPKTPELVAFDTNYQNTTDRLDYFRYNLPGQPIRLINFYSRLCAVPEKAKAIKKVLRLASFLLLSFFQPSELSREYVRTVRACLLVYGYVCASQETAVYLFHLHRHESPFIAAYLQQRHIHINLVAWDPPLAAHNKYLIGDTLKLCNPYQLDEVKVFQKVSNYRQVDLWPLEKIHRLMAFYKEQPMTHHTNQLGLYTQGFWLRTKTGKAGQENGRLWQEQEQQLVNVLLHYLETHPEVHLTVFPHPMERKRFHQTGEYIFATLQNHPQITVDFSGDNSMYQFHQIGLGISLMSSSGFERLYLGFRSLFYVPTISFIDPNVHSAYAPLFVRTDSELVEKIEQIRVMTHSAFMQHFFGKQFLYWQNEAF